MHCKCSTISLPFLFQSSLSLCSIKVLPCSYMLRPDVYSAIWFHPLRTLYHISQQLHNNISKTDDSPFPNLHLNNLESTYVEKQAARREAVSRHNSRRIAIFLIGRSVNREARTRCSRQWELRHGCRISRAPVTHPNPLRPIRKMQSAGVCRETASRLAAVPFHHTSLTHNI